MYWEKGTSVRPPGLVVLILVFWPGQDSVLSLATQTQGLSAPFALPADPHTPVPGRSQVNRGHAGSRACVRRSSGPGACVRHRKLGESTSSGEDQRGLWPLFPVRTKGRVTGPHLLLDPRRGAGLSSLPPTRGCPAEFESSLPRGDSSAGM